MQINKILVPIDYSAHSEQAVRWGASLAERYGAQLLLLHVIPKAAEEVSTHAPGWEEIPVYYHEGMTSGRTPFHAERFVIDLVDKAQTDLHDLARKEVKEALPLQVRVGVGKPAEEILRLARDEAVELIVMGTHGRTGFRHVLLGSIAETVVRIAPCPVFTVRAGTDVAA